MATHTAMAQGSDATLRNTLERRVGITCVVTPKVHTWHGQLRTRFTDFQVNEIDKNGNVVHLQDFHTNAKELASSQGDAQPEAPTNKENIKPVEGGVALSTPEAVEATSAAPEELGNGDSKPSDDSGTASSISSNDEALLAELLGPETKTKLIEFFGKINSNPQLKPKDAGTVQFPSVADRAQRSRIHQEIRRIFCGRIDTNTDSEGIISAKMMGGNRNQRGNNQSRNGRSAGGQARSNPLGGKFLHFSLYKENRDTMDAIHHVAKVLRMNSKDLATAGTKDRRAVTVQRVSMKAKNPQNLVFLNSNRVFGVKIGDFKFENESLRLGSHNGNEFVIVLKNCWFSETENMSFDQRLDLAKSVVGSALSETAERGFLNYFGTQRFGTHEIGTHEIGLKILKGDFEGAVKYLLSFDPALLQASELEQADPTRRESINRAKACSVFLETFDFQAAIKLLPRRCNVEYSMMRLLEKQPKSFLDALMSITRGMRSMYVHAYQSLVWNTAVSMRWEKYGNSVVQGDLVLVRKTASNDVGHKGAEADYEDTLHLTAEDPVEEDAEGAGSLQAKVLSEEDIKSGKYSIFDIVLPTPGFDVVYPQNEIGQFYVEFMGKEENGCLDPHDMRRPQRDFSLPGSYRKMMGKFIGNASASVQEYSKDTEQLVPTDLDLINLRKAKERAESQAKNSGWSKFTDNVQENERKESLVRLERRKAEEMSDESNVRVNDTWVQTSVDGANKRIKVASHEDETITAQGRNSQERSDVALESAANKPDPPKTEHPQVQEEVADSVDEDTEKPGSSIIATVTSQVRRLANKIVQAINQIMAALRIGTDFNNMEKTSPEDTKTKPTEIMTDSREAGQTVPVDAAKLTDMAQQHNLETAQSSHTGAQPRTTTEASTNEPGAASSKIHTEAAATDRKIAIILRFGLQSSSYATMAIRELEGSISAA